MPFKIGNESIQFAVPVFISFLLFSTDSLARENRHTVSVKSGVYSLNTPQQTTSVYNTTGSFFGLFSTGTNTNVAVEYSEDANYVMSVEYDFRLQNGIAFSGELFSFENNYNTPELPSPDGTVNTSIMIGNIKKYFQLNKMFELYIGIGAGQVSSDFNGQLSGSATGQAIQYRAGLVVKFDNVGIYTEYRKIKTLNVEGHVEEGKISGSVDLSGSGIFGGVGIYF